jgi:hypothetical protein
MVDSAGSIRAYHLAFRQKSFAPQELAHPPIGMAEADPPTLCGGHCRSLSDALIEYTSSAIGIVADSVSIPTYKLCRPSGSITCVVIEFGQMIYVVPNLQDSVSCGLIEYPSLATATMASLGSIRAYHLASLSFAK